MITVRSTIKLSSQTVPQIIPVVQGDTGRSILFTLADFTIPQGSTATYYVQKPSGEAVYNTATIDGNAVLVELTAQSIIEAGDNYGQVRIENDGEVVTSFDFILLVKPFRGIDATQSTTEMNIFDKAVEQAEEAIDEAKTGALDDIGDAKDAALQEIEQSTGNFADAFSTSTTYAAGDYVIHSGQLYRFTANHAAGAWSGSDVEAVTVGEELTDLNAETTSLMEDITNIDNVIYGLSFPFVDVGKNAYYNSSGVKSANTTYSYGFADVSGASEVVVDTTELSRQCIINVCGQDKSFIRNVANWANPNKFTVQMGTGEVYICVSALTTEFEQITIRETDSIEESIVYRIESSEDEIAQLNRKTKDILIPILRNGSLGNPGNANSISTQYIIPIDHSKNKIVVEYLGDTSLADEYAWSYAVFRGATDGMTSSAAYADGSIAKDHYNQNGSNRISSPRFELPTTNIAKYDHIMFYLWRYKNDVAVPLRIATDQYNFKITYEEKDGIQSQRDIDFADTKHDLIHAKHAKADAGTRLTILHFSDLHADTAALARIMKDADEFDCDDAICTGDIVADTAGQIESWWDESVLTCIGNHDSASYNSTDGYNWTALSMADRDAYYITPFKSNWGDVVHSSGKSYYYKDYINEKVRLIVMDTMLYSISEIDASLGTAQTEWLNSLLSSAISNNLHVLIAIHAPHGGATPEDCSFSRYGGTTMPTLNDCNTPQVVVDAVATAIRNGLHFVGYLVGHTHQDNIWDAEGDGTQLMYCITCAHVNNPAQWQNSDLHRDVENDAYNIVVVDTTNTLVKLIRGGGANIDDHMRTRKAICINYSTGTVVGEVL